MFSGVVGPRGGDPREGEDAEDSRARRTARPERVTAP